MSKRTRQYIGILAALAAYYLVHEGAGGKKPFRCAALCKWVGILEAGTACLPTVFFSTMNL